MPGELPPVEDIRKVQGRLEKRKATLANKQADCRKPSPVQGVIRHTLAPPASFTLELADGL